MKKSSKGMAPSQDVTGLTVLERVKLVVAGQKGLAIAAVDEASALSGGLHCDALDYVEIQMALESRFGIQLLPDQEIDDCRTVGDLAKLVVKYGGQRVEEAVVAL